MEEKEKSPKLKIRHQPSPGLVWIAAWLFTIGFLHLTFWQGVLAIVIWPYYLGAHFGAVAHWLRLLFRGDAKGNRLVAPASESTGRDFYHLEV